MEWDRHLVIRLPRFSLDYFEQGMEAIWKDGRFRKALLLVGSSWLERLDWTLEFEELPIKLQHTLWKYANRMCHRSTPFGSFTGMGVWCWGEVDNIQIDPDAFETRFRRRKISFEKGEHYINPLSYPLGNGMRFLIQESDLDRNPWKMKELPEINFGVDFLNGKYSSEELSLLKELGLIQDTIRSDCFESLESPEAGKEDLSHTLYTQSSSLDAKQQEVLRHGIEVLRKLCFPVSPSALELFKSAFSKKFEYRPVPVLEALDPDIGIEYPIGQREEESCSWDPVHSYLMKKWMEVSALELEELELIAEEIPIPLAEETKLKEAMDTVVMFSVLSNRLWLKQVCPLGGIPLIARMAPFDERLRGLADEFVGREREADPGVIHADIIYQGEQVMNKVSLPFGFRDYQLVVDPLRGNHKEALEWSDLLLRKVGNELVLFSIKHQKQVVPHLNSAYNVRRDEMPLFRLLVDLSYQGTARRPAFHLKDFFPRMKHYPRVVSQKVILQPACWLISFEGPTEPKNKEDGLKWFKEYAEKVGLPRKFVWKQGDQGLVFDRFRKEDMEVFSTLWKSGNELMLEEWLDQGSALSVKDGGKRYAHELLAFCFSRAKELRALISPIAFPYSDSKISKDWVSYHVYIEPAQQDRFLTEELSAILAKDERALRLSFSQWHFLRFHDDLGSHLRIRFKMGDHLSSKVVWMVFHQWNAIAYVKNVTMQAYRPEETRYGFLGIKKSEQLFQQSSNSALNLPLDFRYRLAYALFSLYVIAQSCPVIMAQIAVVIKDIPKRLDAKQRNRKWDDEFRKLRTFILLNLKDWEDRDPFIKSLQKLKFPKEQASAASEYFLSLFHMQVNRLFNSDHPDIETGCYLLLPKLLAFFKAKGLCLPADEKGSGTSS